MTTLREELDRIRRLNPRGPTHHAQLYAKPDQLKRSYRKITVYTIFVSDENTHMIRPHVFVKDKARTPAEWDAYLKEHLTTIYRKGIIPGLALRTSKAWSVLRIIGWVGAVGAVHKPKNSKKATRRDKAVNEGGTLG